jgi:hypothetical protein
VESLFSIAEASSALANRPERGGKDIIFETFQKLSRYREIAQEKYSLPKMVCLFLIGLK